MLKTQLEFLKKIVLELQASNSVIDKTMILQKYHDLNPEFFEKIFDYIYSYDKKYWITSDNIEKMKNTFSKNKYAFSFENDLFEILNPLINRDITGHNAIHYVIDFINFIGKEYEEIFFFIINKDIKAGTNAALINKVSPNSVKEFHVSLAQRNDEAPKVHEVNFNNQSWMISRKLDGVRVISYLNGTQPIFFSRTGTIFTTLGRLNDDVINILKKAKEKFNDDFVLDGECCLIDENGKEDFNEIMKQITRKNFTIIKPVYILFDLISKKEFDSRKGETIFKERMKKLEELEIEKKCNFIKLVEHKNAINEIDYKEWVEKSQTSQWEGLMLRDENSIYTGKRSFDLQKIKAFYDAEYEVIGIEIGNKKMLDISGVMQNTECVKSLIIEHKNTHTNVGSGLSDEQRVVWFKNPELIMNKIITVQYFSESIDSKTNKPSLRFPTLKFVHGEKREV